MTYFPGTKFLNNGELQDVDKYHPFPVDDGRITLSDIDLDRSDIGDFSGTIEDLFSDVESTSVNSTTDAIKEITVYFKSTQPTAIIGFGSHAGYFRNVKIIGGLSGASFPIVDESTDNRYAPTAQWEINPIALNYITIQFYDTNPVPISNIVIMKAVVNVVRTQQVDVDSGKYQYMSCRRSLDGGYNQGVSLVQNVYQDPNNSTTINLDASNNYTFTGVPSPTTASSAIDILLKTDQDAIVYVDHSLDGDNWDLVTEYNYTADDGGIGIPANLAGSWYRVRVVLSVKTPTTYFRLGVKLVPVSEVLPNSLTPSGNLRTELNVDSFKYKNEDGDVKNLPIERKQDEIKELLQLLLIQQKITNSHLASMTDEVIIEADV